MTSSSPSRWIPLESNPEVFNDWASKAGLIVSQAQFGDIYGLDLELLNMVPGPVKAIILLFPGYEKLAEKRRQEYAKIAEEGQPKLDPTIFWIKQTIGNACGTIALIHALANSSVTFVPNSPLAKFIDECKDKTPEERAHLLETTPLFANIHSQTAQSGQTTVPTDLDTDLHFICFVQAPEANFRKQAPNPGGETEAVELDGTTGMRLIELDGERGGPIDRGECKDLLLDVAKIVKEGYISESSSMQFCMMSLGPPG